MHDSDQASQEREASSSSASERDRVALTREVTAWAQRNIPSRPNFPLPQTPLEVSNDEQCQFFRTWQAKVYEAGYVGSEWPVEYGGGGRPRGTQRVIDQALGRAGAPFLINIVGLSWAGPIILQYGSEAQKRRYVAKILSAEEIWCQGFSEPEAGSDLASLRTQALQPGGPDSDYVVNGHKVWTSQAHFASFMILMARTDPETRRHAGISYFLFPMDAGGVEVVPLVKMTGEGGFNQVIFTDAPMPRDSLLGEEGQGWEIGMATLNFERGASDGGAGNSGAMGPSVPELLKMADGLLRDGKPVLEDPVVLDRIASFAIEAQALRFNAVRGRIPGLVADRPMAIPLMSKLLGSEHQQRLADFGCELQGDAGALWVGDSEAVEEGEWQRAYLNSYAMTIAGGTSEILRNILGEKVLGLPKTR